MLPLWLVVVMTVSKIIKLTSSLFSMLFLETAMFFRFGGETPVLMDYPFVKGNQGMGLV